ncbi:hypothetical protein FNO01nite_29480 [Flavobacterium noncentrifugens]|uniref:RDD family protein n=1 Tax=Flavobacterium noncentrifugens TaxID=1128970 RepID=A0A1G8Y3P0_9FLAO|nr:RDD family protein [Flavobacterium noncentrifugens]GEP52276.1 hypothetical protein FNO01nite_29480 [Flavobacterium noncentrifugens]SDJ96735.1 RDD family protein [Flavobacterium noncentrifugens]
MDNTTNENIILEEVKLDIASNNSRVTNMIADSIIFYIIYYALISYSYEMYGADTESDPLLDLTFLLVSFLLVYTVTEYFFSKTIGKFISRTNVVNLDGTKPGLRSILSRTLCRLIPCEAFSFMFLQNGLHDKFSKTRVVND